MTAYSSNLAAARRHWAHLPRGLLDHLERVSALAAELAVRWSVDPERSALAGYLHDVARAQTPHDLLAKAEYLGLAIHPVEAAVAVLLHGPVGAALVRQELKIADEEVLAAITWHSTGRWGMSNLEKVVFLADKLDPEKDGYYPGLEGLPALAQENLDRAVLHYLEWQIRHLLERGGLLHPATIDARNWLLQQHQEHPRLKA